MVRWDREAKRELCEFPGLIAGIVSARGELADIDLELTAIPSSCRDAPRVAGGDKRQEEHRLSLLAKKEALQVQIELAERKQQRIQAALSGLSQEHREVLEVSCIEGGNVEQIMDSCHVSRSRAFALQGAALHQYALRRFAG